VPDEDELLAAALEDPFGEVRRVAVMTIGRRSKKSRDPVAAARVAPLLSDPDPEVRFWVGNVLMDIGVAPVSVVPAVRENLKSEERLVRLGALRVVITLGPAAADAVPELLPRIGPVDLGGMTLWALSATEVMNAEVRRALEQAAKRNERLATRILMIFGKRAAFLTGAARDRLLDKPHRDLARALASAATDPAEFLAWVEANRGKLPPDVRAAAYEELGTAGLAPWLRGVPYRPSRAVHEARIRVRELGPPAVHALLDVANGNETGPAALATELLGELAGHVPAEAVLPLLDAADAGVRAAAARTITDFLCAGADHGSVVPALLRRLDDGPAVRAAVFHALAAAGTAPPRAAEAAGTALDDLDPAVRVGAADALFALTGTTEGPLRVLKQVLAGSAPDFAWLGGGGTPARTEDEYKARDRLWAAAARTAGRMGPKAAPLARTVAWAALRHRTPGEAGGRRAGRCEP